MKPCDRCGNSYAPYLIRDLHGNWDVSLCFKCMTVRPPDDSCSKGAEKDNNGRLYIALPDGTKIYDRVKQRKT